MRKSFMLLAAGIAALVVAGAALAATVVVHPGDMDGWTEVSTGASDVSFVTGPGTPPLGTGSAQFSVDSTGSTAAQLRNDQYAGVRLADLTALSYSTYQQASNSGQAVYIILNVDYDGNGTTDDLLFFEPLYQSATFCPSNPQPSVTTGSWQTWNALNGCWWSLNGTAGAGPGTNTKTLSQILFAEPNAAIAAGIGPAGAVRLVAGFGGPTDWGNFLGNADAFTINTTTYDFELTPPTPPIVTPPNKDACKNGGWQNYKRANGSTFKNQGDCIQYVNTGK